MEELNNSTTDNNFLSGLSDEQLKNELHRRGYRPIWIREDKDMIDADLGPGL